MASNITFFSNESAGGAAAATYLQDVFDDVSLPANVNTGYTDTALTNPMGYKFQNDDNPKYLKKTLYISGFNLVQDRSKWIGNKETYEIIWHETFPGVNGYCFGDCRLLNQQNGKSIAINIQNDGIAVAGVIRKLSWLVNGSPLATGTAELWTDGVDLASTISFGGTEPQNATNGVNKYLSILHASANATKDIHEYRLTANQFGTLNVVGVVVYFENTGANIDAFPGNTYVGMVKQTTTANVGITLPVVAGLLGANTVVKKSAADAYSLSTIPTPYLNTIGIGSSGSNSISVSTGTGASYPIGTGVIGYVGTSFYIGSVTNQSTDTLTIAPTLGIGLSGNFYKSWFASSTATIGATLNSISYSVDLADQNQFSDSNGFFLTGNNFYYSEPNGRYRVWGQNLAYSNVQGYPGLSFSGGTAGFLQVEGRFTGAEFEVNGLGVLHATLMVNGTPGWGINTGITGILRKTVFSDSGPAYNIFSMTNGTSLSGCAISKINLYSRAPDFNSTLGILAHFDNYSTNAGRSAHSATTMSYGGWHRTFSDSLNLTGSWSRGASTGHAGGVYYVGTSTNSILTFGYYGTNFALVGFGGGSLTCTLDGASFGASIGFVNSVATLGFHNVIYTTVGNTPTIAAFDFLNAPTSDLRNIQKFLPRKELVNIIQPPINSSDTPRGAVDGQIWIQNGPANAVTWIKLLGRWFQLNLGASSDDPNFQKFIRSHGTSTGAFGGGVQDVEIFNLVAWIAGTASTLGARIASSSSDNSYNGSHYVIDGINQGADVVQALTNSFNKVAWSSFTARGTARQGSGSAPFAGFLYSSDGSTDLTTANGTATADKWNLSAWATPTVWGTATVDSCFFVQGTLMYKIGGTNTSGSDISGVQTRTALDVVASGTSITAVCAPHSGSASGSNGLVSHAVAGGTASTNAYMWNGAAWSAVIASTYSSVSGQTNGQASCSSRNIAVKNGGNASSGASPQNNTEFFNSVSFSSSTASSTSRGVGVSSCV